LSDFFQGPLSAVIETETQAEHIALARSQFVEHLRQILAQKFVGDGSFRSVGFGIFNEIAEAGIFFLADWCL